MTIQITVQPLEWNARCFQSGEKVSGNARGVALMWRDGVITNAFPVHQRYMKYHASGSELSYEDWLKEEAEKSEKRKAERAKK